MATTKRSGRPAARPRGRRPGPSRTREEILAAARSAFAEAGFKATTIRQVAARAKVDPALVMQQFGSKQGLFDAAMELPFDAPAMVARVTDGPRTKIGERLVTEFLALWDDPEIGPQMVGLLRSATSDREAAELMRRVIGGRLMAPVARAAGLDEADLRAQLVWSQMVGLGMARYVLRLEPLAAAPASEVVAWLAPTVQRYLTGSPKR